MREPVARTVWRSTQRALRAAGQRSSCYGSPPSGNAPDCRGRRSGAWSGRAPFHATAESHRTLWRGSKTTSLTGFDQRWRGSLSEYSNVRAQWWGTSDASSPGRSDCGLCRRARPRQGSAHCARRWRGLDPACALRRTGNYRSGGKPCVALSRVTASTALPRTHRQFTRPGNRQHPSQGMFSL